MPNISPCVPAQVLAASLELLRPLVQLLRQRCTPVRVSPRGTSDSGGSTGSGGDTAVSEADCEAVAGAALAVHYAVAAANTAAKALSAAAAAGSPSPAAAAAGSGSAAPDPIFNPREAAAVLRLIGELCAAAVAAAAASALASASGRTFEALADDLCGRGGWPMLAAALASASPVAKWRLGRCIARLSCPAVLQHLPLSTVSLLAVAWGEIAAHLHCSRVPSAFAAGEAWAARHETLAAPAAVLLHLLPQVQRCVAAASCCCGACCDESGEDFSAARDPQLQKQLLRACAGASAALKALCAAVLQTAGNPAVPGACSGGCGGSCGGGVKTDDTSTRAGGSSGSLPTATAASTAGMAAAAAKAPSGAAIAATADRGTHAAAPPGAAPQPEQHRVPASLALADTGALAALTAVLRLDLHAQHMLGFISQVCSLHLRLIILQDMHLANSGSAAGASVVRERNPHPLASTIC